MVKKVIEAPTMDPLQFRVPASDTKGHNARMYFRCQPGHSQQVEMLVQARQFPYRTKGDLLRHALAKHLHWLERIGDWKVPSVMAEVDAILEVVRDDEFSNDFQVVFEKLGERISFHLGSGSDGEARRLLLKVQKHVGAMPEGYWKDKYQDEIGKRWGHVLDNAPKASLRHMKED